MKLSLACLALASTCVYAAKPQLSVSNCCRFGEQVSNDGTTAAVGRRRFWATADIHKRAQATDHKTVQSMILTWVYSSIFFV
jgi:hypothetical protein